MFRRTCIASLLLLGACCTDSTPRPKPPFSDTSLARSALAQNWPQIPKRSRADVLQLLKRNPDRERLFILSGQNLGTADSSEDPIAGVTDFVERLSPHTPALLGVDYGWQTVPPSDKLAEVNQVLIEHWNNGGLVTISIHIGNPFTGGHAKDLSSHDLIDLTRQGSETHEAWMQDLRRIADALQELKDAGVVVLWRPFHEMNGGWFWWAHPSGSLDGLDWTPREGYVAMWQHMHQYFTEERGLDHLLWVYSPNATFHDRSKDTDYYFPGDAFVDVVGLDAYTSTWTWEHLNNRDGVTRLRALKKPLIFGEVGPDHKQMDGTFDPEVFLRFCAEHMRDAATFQFWHSWERTYFGFHVRHRAALADQRRPNRFLSDPRVGGL